MQGNILGIEAGWKGKLVELWKKEALELEGFEAMPTLLAAEMAKAASLAGVELDTKIEIPKEEIRNSKCYMTLVNGKILYHVDF